MVAFGTIHDWTPSAGNVVSWHVTPAARAVAAKAAINPAPASYQQEQHLRAFRDHRARGLDMARLCFGAWDLPGTCDVEAMTDAINAHVRRHDTYHSWFEFNGNDLVRHAIDNPEHIELAPTDQGHLTPAQIRAHLLDSTPDPLDWGCFGFGVIQRDDHFTVYMNVDHLVTDGMSAGVIFLEIHLNYASTVQGGPMDFGEPGSYLDYCVRERHHNAALTLESPQVRGWIEFAELNGGTLPGFPLPLGDADVPSRGAMVVVPLMDEQQADAFDAACEEAGARFSGGVFACAAVAERELTGAETYCGLTPYDMRRSPTEFMTAGWFASFMPITVPIAGRCFADAARAAQDSFDAGKELAQVSFQRVLELAQPKYRSLRFPDRAVPLLSFLDARKVPLTDQWDELNVGIFGDSRLSDQVCMWVNRFAKHTTLTISFPDNPVARDSVTRYIDAIKAVYSEVAGRDRTVAA